MSLQQIRGNSQLQGTVPTSSFQTGSWIPVQKQTVTSTSTITFSSLAASVLYRVDFYLGQVTSPGSSYIQFNGDTGSNYAWWELGGSGQSSGSTRNMSTTQIYVVNPSDGTCQPGDCTVGSFQFISNPVSTNQVYVIGEYSLFARGDGFPTIAQFRGRWNGGGALSSFVYTTTAGTVTGSMLLSRQA